MAEPRSEPELRVDRFCGDSLVVVDIEPRTTPEPARRAVREIKGVLSRLPASRRAPQVIFVHANTPGELRQMQTEWEATVARIVENVLRSAPISDPRGPLGLIDVSAAADCRPTHKVGSRILRKLLDAFPDPTKVRIFQTSEELRQQLPQITAALPLGVRDTVQGDFKAGNVLIETKARSPRRPESAGIPVVRDDTGRLNASRVADVLGVSESQLAKALGRSRQAVNKTPNAPAIQEKLGHLERLAWLRGIFGKDADYHAWLRTRQDELGRKSPMDLLLAGKLRALEDLADDIVAGNPA